MQRYHFFFCFDYKSMLCLVESVLPNCHMRFDTQLYNAWFSLLNTNKSLTQVPHLLSLMKFWTFLAVQHIKGLRMSNNHLILILDAFLSLMDCNTDTVNTNQSVLGSQMPLANWSSCIGNHWSRANALQVPLHTETSQAPSYLLQPLKPWEVSTNSRLYASCTDF